MDRDILAMSSFRTTIHAYRSPYPSDAYLQRLEKRRRLRPSALVFIHYGDPIFW